MQALLDMGVSTRRGIMNIHREDAYADKASHRVAASQLARSIAAQEGAIILPLFAQMTEDDVSFVTEALCHLCSDRRTAIA